MNRPFILKPDTCGEAIGYILSQIDDATIEYMVECDSRRLKTSEYTYSIYELEMLAYILRLIKCRQYLDGVHLSCWTDHEALKWFDSKRHELSKQRLRWYLLAQGFNFTFYHRPGKLHTDADAVSRVWSHEIPDKTIYLQAHESPFQKLALLNSNQQTTSDVPFEKTTVISNPDQSPSFSQLKRQLNLLDFSNKTLDPWGDSNLLTFLKTGKHQNGLSKKSVLRTEHIAKKYLWSYDHREDGLYFKYQAIPGKDLILKNVPKIELRESLV